MSPLFSQVEGPGRNTSETRRLAHSFNRLAEEVIERATYTADALNGQEMTELRHILLRAKAYADLTESGDLLEYLTRWHEYAREKVLQITPIC